jgi:hypothetical protein
MARVKSTSRPIAIDSQLEVADAPPPPHPLGGGGGSSVIDISLRGCCVIAEP